MTQNMQSSWPEKIAHAMEENFQDATRKSNIILQKNPDNDAFINNSTHSKDKDLITNMNLTDDSPYQRRSRSNRYIHSDETELESANLTLKHSPSTDTLYSRGSRNLSRHSPVESYRNIRNSTNLHPLLPRRDNKDGINIIMLVGFAVGIAFGVVFNIVEVYLKWIQTKIIEIQMRVLEGKNIHSYYAQEESLGKKMLYGPLCGILLVLQSFIYVTLITIDFLKKPAPKTLINNIVMRYTNE